MTTTAMRIDDKGFTLLSSPDSRPNVVTRSLEARSINTTLRTADFIASTDAIDSYDEIVEQVWDLSRYNTNPIVLYAHDSSDLPIGACTRCEVVRGALECTIQFCTADENPKAEQVWRLVQNRVLRGVSVGFVPKTVRLEKRNGEDVYVLSNNVLHEISVVPIPANPEALAKMKSAALADHNHHGAPVVAVTENLMNENEMKAQIAERDAEIAKAKADATASDARAKAAEDKAKALETKLAETAEKLSAESQARTDAETRAAAMMTERDAATAKAAELVDQLTEREVDDLVGTKITAAQKDTFLALAKKDRASFDAVVATLQPKPLLEQIVPKEKDAPPPVNGVGNSHELAALMNESEV